MLFQPTQYSASVLCLLRFSSVAQCVVHCLCGMPHRKVPESWTKKQTACIPGDTIQCLKPVLLRTLPDCWAAQRTASIMGGLAKHTQCGTVHCLIPQQLTD